MRLRAAVLLVVLAVGGCSFGGGGCPAALLTGTLEVVDGTLAVRPDAGPLVAVRWPGGFGVRAGSPPVLVDGGGNVIAVPGERIAVGGGMSTDDRTFIGCGELWRVEPGAT